VLAEGLELDAVDLSPVLLEGQNLSETRTVFWNRRGRPLAAARRGNWKLVLEQGGHDTPKLFNLAEDRGEQHDLSEQYPERVEGLTKAYQQWKEEVTADATEQPDEQLEPPAWLKAQKE
jgi:arylsulfatase